MSETADTLRAWAREALAKAQAAKDAGDVAAAMKHMDFAMACEAKLAAAVDSRSGNVQATSVTAAQAQLARRGRAVAKAHAHNAVLSAIANDKAGPGGGPRWGSARVYCKKQLKGLAPSSLTGYMDGTTPCPRWVDTQFRKDFPGVEPGWKRGVVD